MAQPPAGGVALLGRGGWGAPRRRKRPCRVGPELSSPAAGGGENGSASPLPGCAGPTLPPPPRSARRSGLAHLGRLESLNPRAEGGVHPASWGGGGVHQRDAGGPEARRAWEAGRAQPSHRPSAPVLRHEHLAARCDPGRGPRTTRARRGVGMPLVCGTAAAADAPAQASAPRARWCPMLQAERALSATACTRRAAALRSRERDALGRRPRGPHGIRQEGRPPLEEAGVVVHEWSMKNTQRGAKTCFT